MSVSMRLEENTLVVDFTAKTAGEFTWPVIPTQPVIKAYILPLSEGVYAPAHDQEWSAHLEKQEGISTTEGLSLPLWGLDCGSHTVTYLLTNPFNNELTFSNAAGNLASRFTHQFTRNWQKKTYGFRISLGPASPVEPARQYRRWLINTGQFVRMAEKIRRTPEAAKLLGAPHVYLWGDGISPEMITSLHRNGFDRLWLGSPGWPELRRSPQTIPQAKEFGYLIGPYDSYHSIHAPDTPPDETWETAQFDQNLYDTGAITRWDGKKSPGFQGKGYHLSPLVTQPYVEKRVSSLMQEFHANSWFIDCDAFGELFDDYSPQHPATQQMDMQARLRRLSWIRDTYNLVIGSEGGSAYAASTIHFAHGMMTQGFGWGDPDLMKDRNSPYFLGKYVPANAPTLFFTYVPLKPSYYRFYFDPRYRLPLYQTVFHDSVVTTHHWSMSTLKFKDQVVERSLMELLYSVPPLYHLNQKTFLQQGDWIKKQYAFFSPLHRVTGLLPMTDFTWLTTDHQVQRTLFGNQIELVANFTQSSFRYKTHTIPARSILAVDKTRGSIRLFTPTGINGS